MNFQGQAIKYDLWPLENTRIGGIGERVEIAPGQIAGKSVWRVCAVSPHGLRSEGQAYATEAEARADYDRRILHAAI